ACGRVSQFFWRAEQNDDGSVLMGRFFGAGHPGLVLAFGPALAARLKAVCRELCRDLQPRCVVLSKVDDPCAFVRHALPQAKVALNCPSSSTCRRAWLIGVPAAMAASNWLDSMGMMLPRRMKSMLRAPVTTSVHRAVMASTTESGTSSVILLFWRMRAASF